MNHILHARRRAPYEKKATAAAQAVIDELLTQARTNLSHSNKPLLNRDHISRTYIRELAPVMKGAMQDAVRLSKDDVLGKKTYHSTTPSPRLFITKVEIPFILNPHALDWITSRIGWAADEFSSTTYEALEGLLEQSTKEGWSIYQTSQALEGLGVFSSARAEMVARTEVMSAFRQGDIEGWRESGVVSEVRLSNAYMPCDVCISLAEAGTYTFEEAEGIDLHPNCMCIWLPVMAGG